MIIVTGGAGFIGSAIVWRLNAMGETNILVVDDLGCDEKWKNLRSLKFSDYIEKGEFLEKLNTNSFNPKGIQAIFHMGACSSTTEQNASYLIENNYAYSKALLEFAAYNGVRFIYASSAATYGSGENGYQDNEGSLPLLKPLNMYGYSKQLLDLWAARRGMLSKSVGLKYFNVFGPNEYHKDDMRSMVLKAYNQINETGRVNLFKSYRSEYADGEQVRDFLYIMDAVDMTLFFMEKPKLNGLFNIGSGHTTTWKQMMENLFESLGKPPKINYIDMPEILKDKYQYHTLADISKIRKSGYDKEITTMKDAIADYAGYLKDGAHLS